MDEAMGVAGQLLGAASPRWQRLEAICQEFLGAHPEEDGGTEAAVRAGPWKPADGFDLEAWLERDTSSGASSTRPTLSRRRSPESMTSTGPGEAKRVIERDHGWCTVPGCSRPAVHAHHIRYRSHGGGDDETNQTGICLAHHLHGIHKGYVRVRGGAPDALVWELGEGE